MPSIFQNYRRIRPTKEESQRTSQKPN